MTPVVGMIVIQKNCGLNDLLFCVVHKVLAMNRVELAATILSGITSQKWEYRCLGHERRMIKN